MRRKRQSGFTLLEAMMASVLLSAAAAGVLLPITAAAAAQRDAQRRVLATRFAADVIERLVAGDALAATLTPADLGYAGHVYEGLTCTTQTTGVMVQSVPLVLLEVRVLDRQKPIATLKTLVPGG